MNSDVNTYYNGTLIIKKQSTVSLLIVGNDTKDVLFLITIYFDLSCYGFQLSVIGYDDQSVTIIG